jgi:hypothetical protein
MRLETPALPGCSCLSSRERPTLACGTPRWWGVTTLAAFLGFYLAEAAILDLGSHPWYRDLQLTLGSGRVYEKWGLLSGSAYGALGGIWMSRRLLVAPIAVGLAFICEPLIVWLLWRAEIWAGAELLFDYPWLWFSQMIVGVGLIAFLVAQSRRSPARNLEA